MDRLPGASLVSRVVAVAGSRHIGRATRAARILNFVGTVRGAVTTVLLLASAAGGAQAANIVREDLAAPPDQRVAAAPTARPTASPLSAAALRTRAETNLKVALAANVAATEELRKIAVASGGELDALIADAKRQMQLRYDKGLAQVTLLIGPAGSPGSASTASPPSASTQLLMNVLIQIAADDFNAIVARTAQAATGRIPAGAASSEVAPLAPSDGASAAALRSDASMKMLAILDADSRSADDLRKIATIPGAQLDPLIADTKRALLARYDEGLGLLDTLVAPVDPSPVAAPSVAAVNALVGLIANDLNAILANALHAAGAPVAALRTAAPPPSFVPQPAAFVPQPPTVRLTIATSTPTVQPRTSTPAPRATPPLTPTPAPRTPAPPTPTVRATVVPTAAPTPAPKTAAPTTTAPLATPTH